MNRYALRIRILTLATAFLLVMVAMYKIKSGAIFGPNTPAAELLGLTPTPASR